VAPFAALLLVGCQHSLVIGFQRPTRGAATTGCTIFQPARVPVNFIGPGLSRTLNYITWDTGRQPLVLAFRH
jgi:hypothetical protein